MVTDASSPADRREFFRINDTVLLQFKPISAQEAEQLGQELKDTLHSAHGHEKISFEPYNLPLTTSPTKSTNMIVISHVPCVY